MLFHDTGPALPRGAVCYSEIGPFTRSDIPKGLLHSHRLKAECWAILTVQKGSIGFIWEDGTKPRLVTCGQAIIIPPAVPHHLELKDDVTIEIAFHNVT